MKSLPGRVLGTLSLVVPATLRADWMAEWRGELFFAARGAGRSGLAVLIAALEDAIALRMRGMETGRIARDLRLAARSLRRNPGFTVAALVSLGLGIGVNVALFSAVRGVLIRPLPYDDPESVALVDLRFGAGGEASSIPASEPEYYELRDEATAFVGLAAYYASELNLGGLEEPVRVGAAGVTSNLLGVLGIEPALGRGFAPDEDGPGAGGTALISHGLWDRAYGRDPGVPGRTILLDDRPYTVVGILPTDFEFPGFEADVLYTLSLDAADPGGRSSHWMSMVARLAPGVDVTAAQARTDELVERWSRDFPERHGPSLDNHPVRIRSVRDAMAGDLRRPMLLLWAAVVLVLLVACLNVANLLLVRADDRRRELGVRTALGAGRAALTRQLLVEALLLAGLGGLAGTALAALALRVVPGYARELLPVHAALSLDGTVLLFAAAASVASAVVFGVLPGWAATSGDVADALRDAGGRSGPGRRGMAVRRGLVVVEVAAAVVLLAGAGVLVRGFLDLTAVEPGFDPAGVVTMDFELTDGRYPTGAEVAEFHRALRRRVEALPGVLRAGSIRTLPMAAGGGWETLDLPGRAAPPHDAEGWGWTVQYQVVDPGIFDALGIPLLTGRRLVESDDATAPPVAVLNRSAARTLFEAEDPLGRELRLGPPGEGANPLMRVVGVVGDVRQEGLDRPAPPQLYVSRAQAAGVYGGLGTRFATFVVKTTRPPGPTIEMVREAVRALDPRLPVTEARTLREQMTRASGDRRFLTLLMTGFSLVGLALGLIGLYGLLAFVVARRTREIGIRIALGAAPGSVVGRVMREGLVLVAAGGVLGVTGALLGADLLEGLAYGVSTRDPLAFGLAPVLLLVVGALASWLPARRASAIDPAASLRVD